MKAHLAAAATGIQVGAALVGSAAVVGQTGSGMLGLARYAVALLILAPVAWHIKGPPIAPADRWPVALIGIGQFGVLIALLNVAVRHIPSAQAALIFATLPLVTLVLAAWREHQPIDRRALLAILASVGGVATLLGGQASAGVASLPSLLGLACAALATLTGALCSVFYRPYLQRYGVVRVSALAMAASLPPLAVLALVEGVPVPPVSWPMSTVAVIVAVGLSSGVGFLMWLYALANAPAGVVTAFLALSPATTLAVSVLVHGTPVAPWMILASALIVGSLVSLASRR